MSVWPISRQAAPERGDNTGISVGPPLQGGKEGGCIHARRRLDERHLAGVKRVAPKRGQWHPHACGADSNAHQDQSRSRSVHPHACGADTRADAAWSTEDGPSPRVWGRRFALGADLGPGRFIPTRVGQTTARSTVVAASCGSSLRVWGRRTPWRGRAGGSPVHPHACGADSNYLGPGKRKLG